VARQNDGAGKRGTIRRDLFKQWLGEKAIIRLDLKDERPFNPR
jgi:hypothetical protein